MLKRTLTAVAISTLLTGSALAKSASNDWSDDAMDAWIDGKAEATLLFNGNLDSFDINTDVKNGVVSLTGKVDNDIEKELASELILGIDGVAEVNNMLTVSNETEAMSENASEFTDAKINTVITSRYLFNSEVSGLDIDVEVDNRVVTLNGSVASEEEKQLAIQIAQNANDVKRVTSNLTIENTENSDAE